MPYGLQSMMVSDIIPGVMAGAETSLLPIKKH